MYKVKTTNSIKKLGTQDAELRVMHRTD